MSSASVRILASHPVVEAQYKRLLASEKGIRLVPDGERFRVGVFDGKLECLEAGLTLARLRYPSMRPLLVSLHCDDKECFRWLLQGVWGLVTYDSYEKELPRAVRHVAAGQLWFPYGIVSRWERVKTVQHASTTSLPLSAREQEVTQFLFRRFSNKQIAQILRISERTVKFHVGNILEKLHITSREELSGEWVPDLGLV